MRNPINYLFIEGIRENNALHEDTYLDITADDLKSALGQFSRIEQICKFFSNSAIHVVGEQRIISNGNGGVKVEPIGEQWVMEDPKDGFKKYSAEELKGLLEKPEEHQFKYFYCKENYN